VYSKGGNSDYAKVNPNNCHPAFTQEQLSVSRRANQLYKPVLRATVVMDQHQIHADILQALLSDPLFLAHQVNPKPHWSIDPNGYLLYNNLIYVPDSSDLHLRVLCHKHNHILAGHPGQNKTVGLI
jgi:hypothetical protein